MNTTKIITAALALCVALSACANQQQGNVDPEARAMVRAAIISNFVGNMGRPSGPLYFAPCNLYARLAHSC